MCTYIYKYIYIYNQILNNKIHNSKSQQNFLNACETLFFRCVILDNKPKEKQSSVLYHMKILMTISRVLGLTL